MIAEPPRSDSGAASLTEREEYYRDSAATEARSVGWAGASVDRWLLTDLISRAGNLSSVVVGRIVSVGRHDIVTLGLQPHLITKMVFMPGCPVFQELHRRVVEGPSPSLDPEANSTIHEIQDLVFRRDFLAAYSTVLAQIEQLATLPAGWDSYQSPRISGQARRSAAFLLSLLHKSGWTIPQPVVGPSSSGGVVLQWYLQKAEVLVEIGPEMCEYYVAGPEDEGVLLEASVSLENLPQVATEISRFLH